jgi:phosphohistidine phosphatase SixA
LRHLSQRVTGRLVSSPYRRCIETVEPLADALGIPIELDDRLAVGSPLSHALELLAGLEGGLACTHGDVIEAVLGRGLKKGAGAVIDVRRDGVALLEKLKAL